MKLSGKEIVEIQDLTKITNSIYALYQKLYNLEINGNFDTEEYKEMLEYLNIAIEVENRKYREIDKKSAQKIIYYLLEYYQIHNVGLTLDNVITFDDNKLIFRRIIKYLLFNSFCDVKIINFLYCENENTSALELEGEPEDDFYIQVSKNNLLIEIEKDIVKIFLTFVQDFYDSTNKKFEDYLVKTKYNVSFLHKNFEKEFIGNKFQMPYCKFLNSKLLSEMENFYQSDYEHQVSSYAKTIATYHINQLLKLKSSKFNNTEKVVSVILRVFMLKATLLMLDAETLALYKLQIKYYIEGDNLKNDHLGAYLIKIAFEDLDIDRKDFAVFSLKK